MSKLKGPLGIALLVLVCSAGTAVAAKQLITGKDIKDHSITGREIKRKSIPLSALRSVPSSQGKQGEKGDRGEAGLAGEPGQAGASAFTEAFNFGASIGPVEPAATAGEWKFLGSEELVFFVGDRGQVTVDATVAADSGGIDDPEDFAVGICFDDGGTEGVQPFPGTDEWPSPTLIESQRVTVPLVTAFAVTGDEEGVLEIAAGPCVLNETAVGLEAAGNFQAAVLVAAA